MTPWYGDVAALEAAVERGDPHVSALVALAHWEAQGFSVDDLPCDPEQIRVWAARERGALWALFHAGHAAGVILGSSMPNPRGECWASTALRALQAHEQHAAIRTFHRLFRIETAIFWFVGTLFVVMPIGGAWLRHTGHPHLGDALVLWCIVAAAGAGWILRRTWDLTRRIRGEAWVAERCGAVMAPTDVLETWVFAPQRSAARRWDETIRQCGWTLHRWYEQRDGIVAQPLWTAVVAEARRVRDSGSVMAERGIA